MHRPLLAFCLLAAVVGTALAQGGAAPSSGSTTGAAGAAAVAPAPDTAAAAHAASAAPAAGGSVTVDAFTAPHLQLQIASQMGGVVTKVLVEEGDRVTAGQEVIHLNDDLLRAQLAVSEAHTQSAEAQIAAAKARLEMLAKEYERAQLSIQNAENDLKIAKLTADRDRTAVEQTVIRAPDDGEVFRLAVREGEAAEPLHPVFSMVTVDPLDVIAYVPIDTVGHIRVGTTASLKLEGIAPAPLQCTVKVVDRVSDPASGTYRVKLSVPNPDRQIAAGARGNLTFVLTQ